MVRQEIYGYLLAHYAICALICQAATEADIDPDRVKFTRTVRIVRRAIGPAAFPPEQDRTVPRRDHGRHHQQAEPQPAAPAPDLPRAVKRARHNSYRVKRASDKGTRHAGPPTIKLVNLRNIGMAA